MTAIAKSRVADIFRRMLLRSRTEPPAAAPQPPVDRRKRSLKVRRIMPCDNVLESDPVDRTMERIGQADDEHSWTNYL